jgi:hypothetical protein
MKKFVYLILLALTFQSCKEDNPPVDFTTGLVGEYEIKYVIQDAKTEKIFVYIDDPRIKINETFEALVGKDSDSVDYINLPVSEGELDGKYLFSTGSLMTTLYLYKNKKIIGQLAYTNTMGNRWFSFK